MKPIFAKHPTTPPPHQLCNLRPHQPRITRCAAATPTPTAQRPRARRRRRTQKTAIPAKPDRSARSSSDTRRQAETATDGNDDRRKRRQTETTTDGNGGSPTASPARRPPAHRGQRPEQPWNERIGGSLWSFSLSKARTALERTLEPDVQNRRAVGRAHGLRNRQILAVAIPDALPGKQEGVGRKQVVDHV